MAELGSVAGFDVHEDFLHEEAPSEQHLTHLELAHELDEIVPQYMQSQLETERSVHDEHLGALRSKDEHNLLSLIEFKHGRTTEADFLNNFDFADFLDEDQQWFSQFPDTTLPHLLSN